MPRNSAPDQIDPQFGVKLRQARQLKKLSQGQLAQRIGADVHRISKYERGASVPPTAMLVKLADVLDVTTDYLIRGGENRPINAVKDPDLLNRYLQIDTLSKQDRQVLLTLIDAFLKKKRLEELMAS